MAGVDAHSHSGLLLNPRYNPGYVLKLVAHIGALACGGFNHCHHSPGGRVSQRLVHRGGNQVQAFLFGNLLKVATRVEVHIFKPKLAGPGQLLGKGGQRPAPFLRICIAQVDQVAVVGEYVIGREAALSHRRLELVNLLHSQWLCTPLLLVLCEHGKCVGTDCFCIKRGIEKPAR